MIKHKYNVYGVSCVGGSLFNGSCVADDIIKAIELFREKQCSVWNIERKEQVSADAEIGIKSLNILGGYSAEGKSRVNIYGLYKRIMKRDPKAVDDINTLEEAKEIIKMITGNVYLNGEVYQMEQKFVESNMELLSGNKQKNDITLIGGLSNTTNMDYVETINYVMNNITTQKDVYVNVNEKARMHVYVEKLGIVDWYRVDREVLSGDKFALDSALSASELKELKRAVGISWMYLNEMRE